MGEHNHVTRDIKPYGQCQACDKYHQSEARRAAQTVTHTEDQETCPCGSCAHYREVNERPVGEWPPHLETKDAS
jgi:hypothetical protein